MIKAPALARIAAWLLLGGVIFVIGGLIFPPLVSAIQADRASIARSETLLVRYEEAQAELPALEQQLRALQGKVASTRKFLDGTNPAMVAAKLQSDTQRLLAECGLALRSSRTLPPHRDGSLNSIGIQLELGASAAGLQRLLGAVETASPALFINRLSVRVPETGTAPTDPEGQPVLTVIVDVVGFAREVSP